MNASLLNALSAAISDNPVHVLQLRKIVVALAISGRLNETDASIGREEILALLDDVKRRLISQRILTKQKPIVAITHDQLPDDFSDPSKFVSLGQIARVEKGKTGIQQAKPGPYPLVVTAAERITADHYDFDGAAAIIPLVSSTGHGNASINRLHYQEGQFALGTILAAVLPHDPALFSARFLFEYLSAFKEELLVSRMSGTANVTLTLGRIEDVPVPLVPPVIQQQLDELMALCDELEAARTERETKRDRLTAASLARLNTPDPETFRNDARFALDALPALTARPDQIKQLRQTILNLAVRGKLVSQDPADEPASELLRRVEVCKPRNRKPTVKIDSRGAAYDVPATWTWASLDQLVVSGPQNGISPRPTSREDAPKAITLSATTSGKFNAAHFKCVEGNFSPESDFWLSDGDLLFQRGNTPEYVGMAAIYHGPPQTFLFPDLIIKVRVSDDVALSYVHLASISPSGRRYLTENASGAQATMPKINQTTLLSLPIPLPPLAEQRRIVAKVDELMVLCDQLETSLTSADATRKKLLDALLAEALVPMDAESLREAAE
ncbi:restriction endonuclease subunit S [Rhizobium sp. G187]|uniref:restriction endonuclease subunit S n=1 Tax=Rhizobium sp. G187 TaxID=3451352 RepID=UPI003EE63409